jgi:hypothetical protein
MNMTEVTLLNRTVSGFTRSSPSDIEAAAWYLVLRDFDYATAEQAVVKHFTGPNKHAFFEVGFILDGIKEINRHLPHQIEDDVRSAKARGLIEQDWPRNEPLPAEVSARLREARQSFERQMDAITGRPVHELRSIDFGGIGKRAPNG